ncbi:hypothetical protein SAMN05443633_104347 [Chryseobacterium arachidis]|uniref:Uncharacterized protein n=1 Tax=Chryseobacterium arachidis TaxID=1416778 RepID=A0A1M5BZS7_9FLAO|nr:hypothetical protein [Chryseobacterium arachidis]SHF47867.1 hypothetical protein SAMN05443633_104347 [Chryseobacterium arachidis]
MNVNNEVKIRQKYEDKNTINIHQPIIDEELKYLFKKILTITNYHKGYDSESLLNYIFKKQCFNLTPLLGVCFLYVGNDWEVKTQIIRYLYEEDKFKNLTYPYKQELLKLSYMLLFDKEYMCRDFSAHLISMLNPKAEELQLHDRNYILGIEEKYLFDGLAMIDKKYFQYVKDDILLKGLESNDSDTIINVIKIMDDIDIFRFWDRLILYIKNKEYERVGDSYAYVLYKILSVFKYSEYYEEDLNFYEFLLTFKDEFIQEDTLYLAYKAGYENTDLIKDFIEKNKDKKSVKQFLTFLKE